MTIGVPKEVKAQENRVSMIPAAVGELVRRGHEVLVQAGAGMGSSFTDDDYSAQGAKIVPDAGSVFGGAELIVKVKEPQPPEMAMLKPHHILFTYLHLAASLPLTKGLLESGCTGIAYETIMVGRSLPLLEPMSEIAGRMAPITGAYHLARHLGGRGTLLGGVPGVAPAQVLVLGGGTAGVNAARTALGMGARVVVLEINIERMRQLDLALPGLRTVYSSSANLRELLPTTDLVIGTVLIPGAAAPKLISREMLCLMPRGSVIVDIAVDQGGCVETTRPTTHERPTFVEEGVIHYCVGNMPGAYARTATQALSNATQRWVELLAEQGVAGACRRRPELLGGVNVHAGKLTCAPVGVAHDLPVTAASAALGLGG